MASFTSSEAAALSRSGHMFAPRVWMLILLLAAACGLAAGATESSLERVVAEARQTVRDRSASGAVHVVEIDARSIAAIDRWPWPRRNHAQVVDRLRAAGAEVIAFDVDFSSRSSSGDDRLFAASLERAGGSVVLPTFRQHAGGGSEEWIDSLPTGAIRNNAVLASVSVKPDADGKVRAAPTGRVTAGVPRPSLSAAVVGLSGSAGDDFAIDFAIRPDTIPRHSFIDIRDGRFDPAQFAGKRVLIGATAVELGDRYGTPRYGVIPGVVIQALAAETLLRGVPTDGGWLLPLIVALGLGTVIARAATRDSLMSGTLATPMFLFIGAVAADMLFGVQFALVPAFTAAVTATLGAAGVRAYRSAQRKRSHDAQTGLPNRYALRQALAGRGDVAVATARIREFDKLVASLDPAHLEQMLLRVADRVATITGGGAVHRIDERAYGWIADGDEARTIERFASLRTIMIGPLEIAGRRIDVTIAMGLARIGDGGIDRAIANAALAADQAVVSAAPWHVHRVQEEDQVAHELSLLGELDEAIAQGQITVLYQPKLDLKADRIASVEALVRWQHPTRGFLSPDLFIPLAERNGRIGNLTLHVIATALAATQHWRDAGHAITAAVNLSATLLSDEAFLAQLRSCIADSGVDPRRLTLEVTESATMSDPDAAVAALTSLRALGIAISMDDYGTGQSTLSYLKRLPLDELKIDRSFVQFVHRNRSDAVVVRSTIELAHELGLKVVAEGVEDAECLAHLRTVGCDHAQGYLISRPIDAEAILALIAPAEARRAAA